MSEIGFWDDQETARSVVERRKSLLAIVEPLGTVGTAVEDLSALMEMAEEDEGFAAEVPAELTRIEKQLDASHSKGHINYFDPDGTW